MTPETRKIEALLQLGRADDAVRMAESLPEREVPTPEFLRLRGRALRAAGRMFDAETSFREALSLTPGDAGLLADLATTLLGQKRHREALAFAREATSVRPEVSAYHALAGFLAESLGFDEEAERELAAARGLAPDDANSHVVYGFLVLRQGLAAQAEAAFRDALRADPQASEAHRGLARALAEQGERAAGQAAWNDARAIDPTLHDLRLERQLAPPAPPGWRARLAETPHWLSLGLAGCGMSVSLLFPLLALPLFALALLGPAMRFWIDRESR
jgi:tetratricopeptide (TPR) repeat protein